MERYITDSLEKYAIGVCPECQSTIGHADLQRRENWGEWNGDASSDVPLLWQADGVLQCAICNGKRNVTALVDRGSVQGAFGSMVAIK